MNKYIINIKYGIFDINKIFIEVLNKEIKNSSSIMNIEDNNDR